MRVLSLRGHSYEGVGCSYGVLSLWECSSYEGVIFVRVFCIQGCSAYKGVLSVWIMSVCVRNVCVRVSIFV